MTPSRDTGAGGAREGLARAHQLWALLGEVEECAAVVPPEAMAALLAEQGAARGEAFPLARAWLDAVRAAQAHRAAPAGAPFAPRSLRLEGGEAAARDGAGALHARALRVGRAR